MCMGEMNDVEFVFCSMARTSMPYRIGLQQNVGEKV